MGRFSPSTSYGHRVARLEPGLYRLHWTYDRYVRGSQLRFPCTMTRDTDLSGAQRFAKRWDIAAPVE